uniref:DH domain-containing protein n=1 Tax=Trichobilharzia regenti TaxID=157069 RepID=A0AA85IRG2_TRIRE|nr:unnamed protein product [Trichobilharzia regenti]
MNFHLCEGGPKATSSKTLRIFLAVIFKPLFLKFGNFSKVALIWLNDTLVYPSPMTVQNDVFRQLYKCHGVDFDLSRGGKDSLLLQIPKTRSTLSLLTLSQNQLERVNIISELRDGENVLVNDLKIVVYKHPLEKLGILTSTEIYQLFYTIESVIPIFERLINDISLEFNKSFGLPVIGTILSIWLGVDMLLTEPSSKYLDFSQNWYSLTSRYIHSVCENYVNTMPSSIKILLDYSVHLYEARKYFDALRQKKPAFTDFLSRCSQTNFSKRLDLWHFLECPKTRLIRYPLLLDRLIKLTPTSDPEFSHLLIVRSAFTCIAQELNRRIGSAMRDLYLEHIEFNLASEYKAMIWSQKSLLLKGNLHANIGEVTVFIFPELLVVTTSIRPEEQNNNNNDRSTSHFFYSGSPRQTRNSSTTSILNNSPFGSIAPLPLPQLPPPPPPLYQVSCAQPRFGHHRWSLLPSLKSHLPPDLDNVHSAPISSSSQPSKFTRLFRRLSSIIASSSSSSLSPPRPLSTVVQPEIIKNITATRLSNFFISEDDTVCLERYRICYPPLILKDYILEDMSDDDNRSSILKLPFSFEKSRRNLFRLYPYNEYCKRRSVKHVIKGINSLHSSHQRHLSIVNCQTKRSTTWSSSPLKTGTTTATTTTDSVTKKATILFSAKYVKVKPKEYLFQASSLEDKLFWISTLSPLVHSVLKTNHANNTCHL